MRHFCLRLRLSVCDVRHGWRRAAVEAGDEVPSTGSSTRERTVPKDSTARPTKRVVARSDREICETLITSAQSNELPIPFFIRLLFQESGFKPDVVSPRWCAGYRAIHAGDCLKGRA